MTELAAAQQALTEAEATVKALRTVEPRFRRYTAEELKAIRAAEKVMRAAAGRVWDLLRQRDLSQVA